ncbi:I78 family peptidase inhibitor [Novosphingobium sp. Gsoil 351]|uniref:I78 family peptidase inhibitor n=1 Tax=Novosphingobium sp. Gsoil 351 TaxID=2675225 RepID=UPI0012B44CE8|nr:I78 family peptidase inhibitor [Novosphingobium sp. Gsoil 351]QGN53370.1 hypothetical protein GKE62_01190 [Novosphingobium sp. Gsoil 351]
MRALPLLLVPLALAACGQSATPDAAATAEPTGVIATTNATVEPVPSATATASGPTAAAPGASKTAMDATSTPIPANASPSACGADKAAKFVGKVATPDVRAQTIETVGHNRIRWIGPDTAVTMDFSEGRLNMALDANNRITGAKCG